MSEEYARILDVVGKYAIHCKGVAFSCKKHGEAGLGLAVPSNASELDRIRLVYNSQVANELIEFEAKNDRWGFKSEGLISSANFHSKKSTLLLFINHRSVDSSSIKKAVEQTYSTFLPRGGHPFLYLSLEIDPARVDVNVHPTKREVNFLNEEEIIEVICDEIRSRLGKVDTSRTFMTQSLLGPKKTTTPSLSTQPSITLASPSAGQQVSTPNGLRTPTPKTATPKPYENNLVRTDSRARKITSMLPPAIPSPVRGDSSILQTQNPHSDDIEYEYTDREHTICRLSTIKALRAAVRSDLYNTLADVFASHTFVGIVDTTRRIAAIQSGVKLFLIDYGLVAAEFFYQLGLTDFSNFGSIEFKEPLDLTELLRIAIVYEAERTTSHQAELDWEEVVQVTRTQLIERRDMLVEYFAIDITEDGYLVGMPLLLKGYSPNMAKLPNFLLRLGPHVDWDDEKGCFESFLRELAAFYAPEALPSDKALANGGEAMEGLAGEGITTAANEEQLARVTLAKRRGQLERSVENVLFPAFKQRLVATKGLRSGVVEVADLKGLYRVFERC